MAREDAGGPREERQQQQQQQQRSVKFGGVTFAPSPAPAAATPLVAKAATPVAVPAAASNGWGDAFLAGTRADAAQAAEAALAETEGGAAASGATQAAGFSFGSPATALVGPSGEGGGGTPTLKKHPAVPAVAPAEQAPAAPSAAPAPLFDFAACKPAAAAAHPAAPAPDDSFQAATTAAAATPPLFSFGGARSSESHRQVAAVVAAAAPTFAAPAAATLPTFVFGGGARKTSGGGQEEAAASTPLPVSHSTGACVVQRYRHSLLCVTLMLIRLLHACSCLCIVPIVRSHLSSHPPTHPLSCPPRRAGGQGCGPRQRRRRRGCQVAAA